MEKNEKKIAVIVPVYNVDFELVDKCLTSIIGQTYSNFEVYVIDDGNTESYQAELQSLCKKYECVYVQHEKNKGLFQARITGVDASESDYILFVDGDDTISVDWMRLLVDKAEKLKADIVMGRTICVDENGWKYIRNRSDSLYTHEPVYGEKIFEILMQDEGMDFSMHTVWNKLYSRELWNKCLPFFRCCNQHLIMTEDILFSMVLFFYAEKMVFSNHDGYFYYRNAQSSTINIHSYAKVKKNINDLIYTFTNVKKFLEEKRVFEKYKKNFIEWKNRYFRWWSFNINQFTSAGSAEDEEVKNLFLNFFEKEDFEYAKPLDDYFDKARTTWNSKLEEIKVTMCQDKYKIISFDLFDTLIKRPVLHPEDVFAFIANELPIDNTEKNRFVYIRQESEKYARQINKAEKPGCEDITIDEIYAAMHTKYRVKKEDCELLKNKEISLEIEFAMIREVGKELFDLAKYLEKKVIITSDMYLRKKDIECILQKNNYKVDKLYLSSDVNLLKSTGHLFDYVIFDNEEVCATEIMHIGDNWQSDFLIPSEKGIKAVFIPKTKDILFNNLGDAYTGNSIGDAIYNANSLIDLSQYLKNISVRTIYAVIANKLFDNPFCSFKEESNYNGDPYKLGFISLGMHMFGLANWIIKKSIKKGYRKVHFSSRDGYYLMKVYELLREKYYHNAPEANYINISRKSLIPVEVCSKEKVLDILGNISFYAHSPQSIIALYQAVLKPLTQEIQEAYVSNGIVLKKKFESTDECLYFLAKMKEIQYDEEKASQQFDICRRYFRHEIGSNDVIFDLGYSAKLQKLIVDALGYSVDGLYLHNNGYEATTRMAAYGLSIESFYGFIPSMSGVIYEYFFSEYGPSCIGYEENGRKICPVFEKKSIKYVDAYVLDEIHRACNDFCDSLLHDLGTHFVNLQLQAVDTSLLFEKMLMHVKAFDKEIFINAVIEDEYYGGIIEKSLVEIWEWQQNDRSVKLPDPVVINKAITHVEQNSEYVVYQKHLVKSGKIKRALYWWLIDRDFMKKRIKDYFGRSKGGI